MEHTHDSPVGNYTSDLPSSWMAVDLLNRRLVPSHYALRSDSNCEKLRNWRLEASSDGRAWTTLRDHVDDGSLSKQPMSMAAWPIVVSPNLRRSFRQFRIFQTGKNSSGTQVLACTGIELYGLLLDE